MISGKVIGAAALSARHPTLEGAAFLRVQTDEGDTLIAADLLHASSGSTVLLCRGTTAQSLLGCACPVDAAVVGIIDEMTGEEKASI